MGTFTNEIQTVNISGMTDFERIDRNLKTLIVSLEGTIPGSRGFGLSVDITDMHPEYARNEFAQQLDEKIEQYMPEIRIADIDYEMNIEGIMSVRIYIERNDGYEEAGTT